MSAAPPFSPPLAQLPVGGERLSVHTRMDGMHLQQSLPSGEESIDEVQLGLDAQTDELSIEEDRAQIDELEEDLNEGLQHPSNPSSEQPLNSEPTNDGFEPAQIPQLVDQAYGQNDVTPAPEQEAPIVEMTEEPPHTDVETNILISQTDAILEAETLGTTSVADDSGLAPLDPHASLAGLEIPEDDFEFTVPLAEQEISALAQDFAREVEEMSTDLSEHQSNEQESNQQDLQTIESEPVVTPEPIVGPHEDNGAPPLRRMDEDTIPVTAHSKDSIIDALNDASDTTMNGGVQSATTEEQVMQESTLPTSAEAVPEQVDVEMDAQDHVQPEEPVSTLLTAQIEHIQVLETSKDGEGEDITMERNQIVIEQDGEPSADATAEATTDPQPIQIVQEGSAPTVQDEPAALDPVLEDTVTTSGDTAGPIVTVVEQSTLIFEQTSVEQAGESGPSTIDPAPEVTMDTTSISATTTMGSTNSAIIDSVIPTVTSGDVEIDPIERAAQIQRDQDATVQTTEDETQATLVDSAATPNNTIITDDTPDPTAPKDSDSPLRRVPSQSQPPSQLDSVTPQSSGPVDPAATQDEESGIPEETAEPAKPQVSSDQSESAFGAEPRNRQTPEWEGFAALDEEDAHGSPEPEPSSEPSEHPDVVTEDTPPNPTKNLTENPTSASTDKAEEPSNPPTAPVRARKKKKPKMIMEVVIPVTHGRSKVIQESQTTKKRPRGRPPKAARSAKAPAPSEPESPAATSSSPQHRSSSAGTPSPVRSEASESESEPEPQMKKSGRKRSKPFGSRKRVKRSVASGSSTGPRPVHVAHAAKLEVVMPRKPRPSVLKRIGSTSTGNNVKFAPAPSVTGKRKAESEPEMDEEGSDADADGEPDDEYEDVEEEPKFKVEVVISPPKPRKRTKASKSSPVKRPRRSNEARKTPARLPAVVSKGPRPSPKRRRLRR